MIARIGLFPSRRRVALACAAALCLLAFGVLGAAPALAQGAPRWQLTLVSNPTNFSHTGGAVDEVQLVRLGGATGGTFTLSFEGDTTAPIACAASAATVQQALAALASIGQGNVTVTGGPSICAPNPESRGPYTVTFVGKLGGQQLPAMTADGSGLSGSSPTVSVSITAQGKPNSDNYLIVATNTGDAATSGNVTITATLPAGLTATGIAFGQASGPTTPPPAGSCDSSTLTCTVTSAVSPAGGVVYVVLTVSVDPSASGTLTSSATVSGGGGGGAAQASDPTTITSSDTPAAPGVAAGSFFSLPSNSQAGAHPDVTTAFVFNTVRPTSGIDKGDIIPTGNLKDAVVDAPPGLIGSATATPTCPLSDFKQAKCSGSSQVGWMWLVLQNAPGLTPFFTEQPVYNLTPPAGVPAEFGFHVFTVFATIRAQVRTGSDYGLTLSASNLNEGLIVDGTWLTFWGVPADPSHDALRVCSGNVTPCSSTAPLAPFITNPTACAGAPASTLHADFWQQPGAFSTATSTSPPVTGCNLLSFAPSLAVTPTSTVADSPSGVDAELSVPQNEDPNGLATPELRDATVTLPAGASLSPGAADGLVGCTDQQIALHSDAPATCPDASQVGTVTITTPLLPDQLTGQIYIGTPGCSPCTSADAADGNMVHGYIQAQGDGVLVKLPGSFALNPSTGQITAHFDNNPQLPFSDLKLDFKGGPRGVLATPDACGTYTTSSVLVPWSSPFAPNAATSNSFPVASGCVSGFSPSFSAGVMSARAGGFSPFVLSLARADTEQELQGLSVKLPPGMLAKLAGVPTCSDAAAGAGACPAPSQVGTVEVSAGPGPNPFSLPGKVYLTGPYKSGPYGLAVVVPAVAGPFNLGTVVVRQALEIDPTSAQVTAVSDPFPSILDGIPLRIRRVDVSLNRPGFTLDPTSCNPMSVTGSLSSTGGLTHVVSSRFQVGGCSALGFSPKLKIALSGKGETHSGQHPALTATLTDPSGQANIRQAKVTLPLSLALDPSNSQHVCAFATAQAVHGGPVGCPSSTIVGRATAVTPLLSQPLTGDVYLVQGIRTNAKGQQVHALPSLLVPLRGQIALDLRAQSAVSGGKLVTTFSSIPDAPVSKFTLQITGGPKGLLVITGRGKSICAKAQVSNATLAAQSGKSASMKPTLSTPCGKPAHLRVLSRRLTGGALVLRVKTSERGRLTVRGAGVRRLSRVLSAGVHSVRVRLNGRRVRVMKVQVQLSPSNARPAQATFSIRR